MLALRFVVSLPPDHNHSRRLYVKKMKFFKSVLSLCLLGFLAVTFVTADSDSDSESLGTTIGIDLGTTYVWCGSCFFLFVVPCAHVFGCFDDRSPFFFMIFVFRCFSLFFVVFSWLVLI